MKILYIDIASRDGLIALCTEDSVIASKALSNRVSDAELIGIVEKIIPDYHELTHIACVAGPGGFTSLRVAVTFANVLADQLGVPLVGIHLSDVYRARMSGDVYWLHSTQKDHLFIRGGEYKDPTLISLDELATKVITSDLKWAGELIDAHREKVGTEPVALSPIADVLPAFLKDLEYKKEQITPWYGRGW